jgi:cell division protease FtsH
MLPQELELYSKEQILDMVSTIYGGRAAEELFLGTVTTGAKDDLEKATQLIKHYVGDFGMHAKFSNMSVLTDGGSAFNPERKLLTSAYTSQVPLPSLP